MRHKVNRQNETQHAILNNHHCNHFHDGHSNNDHNDHDIEGHDGHNYNNGWTQQGWQGRDKGSRPARLEPFEVC